MLQILEEIIQIFAIGGMNSFFKLQCNSFDTIVREEWVVLLNRLRAQVNYCEVDRLIIFNHITGKFPLELTGIYLRVHYEIGRIFFSLSRKYITVVMAACTVFRAPFKPILIHGVYLIFARKFEKIDILFLLLKFKEYDYI